MIQINILKSFNIKNKNEKETQNKFDLKLIFANYIINI